MNRPLPRPEPLRSIGCPGCGAQVSAEGSSTHASCAHCGRRIWIEEQLQRMRGDADSMRALAEEADRAIERAVRKELALDARTRATIAADVIGAPAIVLAFVHYYAEGSIEDWLVTLIQGAIVLDTAIAVVVAGAVWLWLGSRSRVERLLARRLSELRQDVARRPPEGKCPSCGARAVAPAPSACFECAYCRAPLVLAHGVLIPWIAEIGKRAERLERAAFDTLLEAEVWPPRTWIAWSVGFCLLSIALHAFLDLLFVVL